MHIKNYLGVKIDLISQFSPSVEGMMLTHQKVLKRETAFKKGQNLRMQANFRRTSHLSYPLTSPNTWFEKR